MTDRPVLTPPAGHEMPDGALTVMASALLPWTHCRGGPAQCLARVRLFAPDPHHPPRRAVVVLSELRENPRGHGITADVPGAAAAARATLLPEALAPDAVTWLAHHGPFSTYDPSGPETFTELRPRWDGTRYTDDVHDYRLLPPDEAAALVRALALQPVDHELRAWPAPAPRAATE